MKRTPTDVRGRRRYDDAFKQDAVNRVVRTGKSCAEVARELGLKPNVLSRWRRERLQKADEAMRPDEQLKPSELAAELRTARLEVEDLREQRDILKKALGILSHQSSNGGRL